MAATHTVSPLEALTDAASAAARGLGRLFEDLKRAREAAALFDAYDRLTEAELAKKGLTREQIAGAVYRQVFETRQMGS
ncbi:MAG: hypothetical protein JJ902_17250 [Roseibium sp.]|nr:hypothetical protein [Roseibium sp.]